MTFRIERCWSTNSARRSTNSPSNSAGEGGGPLWILGPLLRGVLWECTAVPDIRNEAAELAGLVAATLDRAAAA